MKNKIKEILKDKQDLVFISGFLLPDDLYRQLEAYKHKNYLKWRSIWEIGALLIIEEIKKGNL